MELPLLPHGAGGEREQHNANIGIRFETVDDGLSIPLRHFPVETDAPYASVFESLLDYIEGESPRREDNTTGS